MEELTSMDNGLFLGLLLTGLSRRGDMLGSDGGSLLWSRLLLGSCLHGLCLAFTLVLLSTNKTRDGWDHVWRNQSMKVTYLGLSRRQCDNLRKRNLRKSIKLEILEGETLVPTKKESEQRQTLSVGLGDKPILDQTFQQRARIRSRVTKLSLTASNVTGLNLELGQERPKQDLGMKETKILLNKRRREGGHR